MTPLPMGNRPIVVDIITRVEIDPAVAGPEVLQEIKDRIDDAPKYLTGVTVLPRRVWEAERST